MQFNRNNVLYILEEEAAAQRKESPMRAIQKCARRIRELETQRPPITPLLPVEFCFGHQRYAIRFYTYIDRPISRQKIYERYLLMINSERDDDLFKVIPRTLLYTPKPDDVAVSVTKRLHVNADDLKWHIIVTFMRIEDYRNIETELRKNDNEPYIGKYVKQHDDYRWHDQTRRCDCDNA